VEGNGVNAALVVSIISLVFAALALAWNILNVTLLDRARLNVTLDVGMTLVGGMPGTERTVVAVAATNIGKRPVRLHSLWLAFGRPFRWWMRIIPRKWRRDLTMGAIMLPGNDPMLVALSTELPTMLGVGEAATLYYYEQDQVLARAQADGYTHAYATAGGSTARGSSKRIRIPFPEDDN